MPFSEEFARFRRNHAAGAGDYLTAFPATENPIAEAGRWITGLATGSVWSDIRTTPGLAWGTQDTPVAPPYDDSCAYFVPPSLQLWRDIEIEAQVYLTNRGSWTGNHEVELLLRGSLQENENKTYEVLFSCLAGPTYVEIVRWNGALSSFTSLAINSSWGGLNSGDWIKATIIGTVINAYARTDSGSYGSAILTYDTVNDGTKYTAGYAGIGHWKNGTSNLDDYGLQNWRAFRLR